MVFYLLSIWGELENITNLQPLGGCDDPNFPYRFKVKCENCGEISQKETCVVLSETVPLSNGRATANLVQKCKLCGREGSIQMIPGQGQPLTLEQSQAEKFSTLMVFDCRGFEPIGFSFSNGWKAESTSGTVYEIDLSEGDFADYDEKGECPVGVSNLQGKFKPVKKNDRHGKTTYS
ncbi:uncharacterized protein A4U43_C05F20500 [Asparagus officinalis]|uniref:CXXC motif containing zinc binding protein n=1 Tax=Asparagus officinalis TaxID=4686 RepID=A0A5P1EXH3_ASPOF|nr:UPF0587 protein C1orf123 homolog [Asparagus officinalis]XP_020264154.1 UPF0587 protein C1orf123 homolog [Asparagus officinalis]XP_020264155.1 UPF0587 protein C1orf123 homolog [Asparagus officinalis]ONK69211.1 uncharacterized protein A4U43_C05F20500 [Asparagus officinalis]